MWAQGNIIRRGSQGRTNPFAPQEVTKRRCVLSSKFFDHLFYAADTQYYYVDVANKPLTYLKYSIESVEIGLYTGKGGNHPFSNARGQELA